MPTDNEVFADAHIDWREWFQDHALVLLTIFILVASVILAQWFPLIKELFVPLATSLSSIVGVRTITGTVQDVMEKKE